MSGRPYEIAPRGFQDLWEHTHQFRPTSASRSCLTPQAAGQARQLQGGPTFFRAVKQMLVRNHLLQNPVVSCRDKGIKDGLIYVLHMSYRLA